MIKRFGPGGIIRASPGPYFLSFRLVWTTFCGRDGYHQILPGPKYLAMLALGKAMSWSDFFVFAGIMIAIVALLGAFLVIGSRTPDK